MKSILLSSLLLLSGVAAGQTPVSYTEYIGKVKESNKSYAARQLNVNIAEAELAASKVFNDPSLSVEYAYNDDRRLQMGQSVAVGIGKTITIGKRGAGIRLAQSQKELEAALLDDYFRTLRAEAIIAWLEALKQAELYKVKENTCRQILGMAAADSVRHSLGEIGGINALQTALEARKAQSDLLAAQAEMHNSFAALAPWMGDSVDAYLPSGRLHLTARPFNSSDLAEAALRNRADLVAALKETDVARRALALARRERNTDFDLSIGYNYNSEVRNEIAPAPRFNGVTAGIAIPLRFSNANRGAIRAAELRARQSDLRYEQARREVRISVAQSLRAYLALEEQVKSYDASLLRDAQTVMEGRLYSYARGESSLLEALDARRTYDEVRESYIETLFAASAALVRLEQEVGGEPLIAE
jgi:cobalt-zinc-cadmium efflux system outer membrane protein